MARRRETPWMVIGAGDTPNKAFYLLKSKAMQNGYELHICQLRDGADPKNFTPEDVEGEYFCIYFAKKEKIKELATFLEDAYQKISGQETNT